MLDWSYSCKIAFVRGNLAYCPWKCTWDSNPTIDMRTKKKALLCHVLCIWSKPREIPKKNISVRRKVCWSTASSLRRRCRHWSKRLYLFLCFAKVAPIPLSVHSRYCPDLLKSKLFDRLQFRESCRRQLAQISAVSYAACFVRQSFIAVLRSSQPFSCRLYPDCYYQDTHFSCMELRLRQSRRQKWCLWNCILVCLSS